MSDDHLLWDIVLGWLVEKKYQFKTIGVVDGYPIYQLEPYNPYWKPTCVSFMIVTSDKVQITSNRIELSNYMGLQDLTITGPTKTIMAGLPTFFEEMDQYLNREPEPPITNYAPPDGGLQFKPKDGPSIHIHDCLFNGQKINGPIKDPSGAVVILFASMDPAASLQFQNPHNFQTL